MKRFFKLNNPADITQGYSELSRQEFYAYKTDKQCYFLDLGYDLMETSEEEYRNFQKEINRNKYLEKLATKYGMVSYHAMHNQDGENYGEELLEDKDVNVENTAVERVFKKEMLPKLSNAVSKLSADDLELIGCLFSENLSEREIERKYGIPRKTVSYRKNRILNTLKSLMK